MKFTTQVLAALVALDAANAVHVGKAGLLGPMWGGPVEETQDDNVDTADVSVTVEEATAEPAPGYASQLWNAMTWSAGAREEEAGDNADAAAAGDNTEAATTGEGNEKEYKRSNTLPDNVLAKLDEDPMQFEVVIDKPVDAALVDAAQTLGIELTERVVDANEAINEAKDGALDVAGRVGSAVVDAGQTGAGAVVDAGKAGVEKAKDLLQKEESVKLQSETFQIRHEQLREMPTHALRHMNLYRRARVLALMAQWCYKNDEPWVKEQALALGFDDVQLYDEGSAQGYRFESPRDIVIALRGTEPTKFEDIKADLKIYRIETEFGRVHRGFVAEVNKLWPDVKNSLLPEENDGKKLYFTGHSLGGAMATVMAHYAYENPRVISPYEMHTFGSPRTGNQDWVDSLIEIKHHRWHNNNDIIPRLPPNCCSRYVHHGSIHYMDYSGYDRLNSLSRWAGVKDRWNGVLRKACCSAPDFIADHSIDKYVGNLEKMIKDHWNDRKAKLTAKKRIKKAAKAVTKPFQCCMGLNGGQ